MEFSVTLDLRTPEPTENGVITDIPKLIQTQRDSDEWTPTDLKAVAVAIVAAMTAERDPGPFKWRVQLVGPPPDPDTPRWVDWNTYSVEVEGSRFTARPAVMLRENQLPADFEAWKEVR
jgi:hypothetical protein